MKAHINSLHDFFVFAHAAQLFKKANRTHRNSPPIEQVATNVLLDALFKPGPLSDFVKKHKLRALDLDLLQAALTSRGVYLSLREYMERSLVFPNNPLRAPRVLKKVSSAKLVKKGYIKVGNPFSSGGHQFASESSESRKDILELITTHTTRQSLSITFTPSPYEHMDHVISDMRLYDELFVRDHDHDHELDDESARAIRTGLLKSINESYALAIKKNKTPFQQFLTQNNLSLEETLVLVSTFGSDIDMLGSEYTVLKHYKPQDQYSSLLSKKLVEQHWGFFVPSERTKQALLPSHIAESHKTQRPKETFNHVCLSEDNKRIIMDAVHQIRNHDQFEKWGIRSSYGKAITLNFSGPPGTGKTLTAKAIANYLEKPLLTVNYAELQNMYLGETEKNIAQAFKQATDQEAILFFDEADSIAADRKNAVRNWEVSQTNVMLKELENYEGVCIFATNLAEKYDEAFNRRLSAHIHFELPDIKQLETIFALHLPRKAVRRTVDYAQLANQAQGLSGGDVKNVVLNAARAAANAGQKKITKENLQAALEQVQGAKHGVEVTYFG